MSENRPTYEANDLDLIEIRDPDGKLTAYSIFIQSEGQAIRFTAGELLTIGAYAKDHHKDLQAHFLQEAKERPQWMKQSIVEYEQRVQGQRYQDEKNLKEAIRDTNGGQS